MAPNPMYSEHLEFAPTFKWGGREWGANDRAAFEAFLRKRGGRPRRFYRRHPNAARVFDPVEQRVYSEFQPLLTGIGAERRNRQEYYKRLTNDLKGFSSAILGQLGQISQTLGREHQTGADTMSALGAMFGEDFNAEQSGVADTINSVLSRIGSPQTVSGGDPGSVVAALGGALPAGQMLAEGNAYGKAAAQLPHTSTMQSELMMKDLLRQAADEDEEFSDQILQLLQGLPGARAEIRSQEQGFALDRRKQVLAELKADRDHAIKQAYLAQAAGDDRRAQEYLDLARQKEARMQLEDQGLDVYGNPLPGYRLNPKTGRVEKIPTPKKPSASNTPAGRRAKDGKAVAQYQDDIDRYITNKLIRENPSPPFNEIRPRYDEAFAQLWQRFKNTVSTPVGKKKLKQAIRAALAAHGIRPSRAPEPNERDDPRDRR